MKSTNTLGKTFAAVVAGGAIVGAITLGPQWAPSADADPISIEAPGGAPLSFADLVEQVSPAVVSINVRGEQEVGDSAGIDRFLEQFRDMPGFEEFMRRRREELEEDDGRRTRETRALGSGFFISASGHAVTNNHVIAGANEIQLVMSDGREFEAELIGTDPSTDLAVVKVIDPQEDFPYVEFERSDNMRVGDWVVAVGNPFGLGGTATAGIISADGRELGGNSPYTDFLQIDASINRGNSGGPTFDLTGRVIGVNTAIFSPTGGSVGIGFAIPADLAIRITDELISNGRVSRGWLGVSIQDFTPDFAESVGMEGARGAIVSELVDDGPAEASGIERGDVIIEVNGDKVIDATSVTRKVGNLIAGSSNTFVVLRDGDPVEISVTVGERPENPGALTNTPGADDREEEEDEAVETGPLGVALKPLDEDTRTALGLDDDEQGLLIVDVDRDSPAAETGLRPGTAILEVNGRTVGSVSDFSNAIEAARRAGKEQVLIAAVVNGRTQFGTIDISEEE
ncbi:MAG: trypsin-like peptidase domain-containing protein [Pseudomonadota bacterium]